MGRKAVKDGKRKQQILAAASELFFSKGFDGTSVRTIMSKAGGEVGLFYYYFDDKDDAFDQVLDGFFAGYEKDFERIVEHGKRNPCRIMYDFFTYMMSETEKFRNNYEKNMHRTVRWAIREHTLTIIEPFIRHVVEIQSSYYGVKPALDMDIATLYLTYGVGSSILHEDHNFYNRRQPEIQKGTSLIMNMPTDEQSFRIPLLAEMPDVSEILGLFASVFKEKSACEDEETRQIDWLEKRIKKREVWVFRKENKIIAAAVFEKRRQMIECVAVHPDYRGHSMAHRLLETISAQFAVGSHLYARADETLTGQMEMYDFYRHFGFEQVDGRMERVVPEVL